VILYRLNNLAGRGALLRVAQRFRELPILVDHVGLPHASTPEKKWGEAHGHDYSLPDDPDFGVTGHLAELGALPHVFFKVTDINFDRLEEARLDGARFVRTLADAFGAQRLLWGSDVGQSPAPYSEKVARLRHAAQLLDAGERTDFFGATAQRLYGAAMGRR
jgi:L-fuconolactonase